MYRTYSRSPPECPATIFFTQVRFSSARAINTVPTGLPSLVSGPATPVIPMPRSAWPTRRAPTAMALATSALTAPVFLQQLLGHAENLMLDFLGIGGDAAFKDRRNPRHLGQTPRQHTGGAGLGRGDFLALFL